MEKYVCSLEHAKKLKELGVKQESEFYWVKKILRDDKYSLWVKSSIEFLNKDEIYSAFLVGELGEMLPYNMTTILLTDVDGSKIVRLTAHKFFQETRADTEANARAKMLIYLIENKLTKI